MQENRTHALSILGVKYVLQSLGYLCLFIHHSIGIDALRCRQREILCVNLFLPKTTNVAIHSVVPAKYTRRKPDQSLNNLSQQTHHRIL